MQHRVLEVIAGFEPAWTLTGGAALAGFHTQHRATRDLDLFWHDLSALDTLLPEVELKLRDAGLVVERLRSASTFARLSVSEGDQSVVVDLVADPVPTIETPDEREPGIRVDTRHEILVNKLTALLSRSEVRDLEDIRVLVESGGDLDRALVDAPRKDGGFSPLTAAWLLKQFPLAEAELLGFERQRLEAFRDRLIDRFTEYTE